MLTKRLVPLLAAVFVCGLSAPTYAGGDSVGAVLPETDSFHQEDEVIMLAPASFQVRDCMWEQAYLDYGHEKLMRASLRVTEGYPSVSMTAPIHLPASAEITSIRVSYYDTDPFSEPQMGIYGLSSAGVTKLLVDTSGEEGFHKGNHSVTYRVTWPNAKPMAYEFLVTLNRSLKEPRVEHALYRVEIRYRNRLLATG